MLVIATQAGLVTIITIKNKEGFNGENMSFEIAKVTIIRSSRKSLSIQLKPGKIIARAPLGMREKDIYSFIESKKTWIENNLKKINDRQKIINELQPFTPEEINAFTKKAKNIIPERVEYYATKIGVSYNRITIRCQHTRWGSCSAKGNLNFNCLLVLLPEEVLDSIVVHELCHRKQMNHSKKFYDEINKVFPDYKKCNDWLKKNGSVYLSRLP